MAITTIDDDRLWAAIGWGSLSVITGVLVDLTNIGVIFVTFGVGMALSMILVMCVGEECLSCAFSVSREVSREVSRHQKMSQKCLRSDCSCGPN